MLSTRVFFSICVALAVSACHRLSPTEDKLIGTWQVYGTLDATWRLTFNRDHSLVRLDDDDAGAFHPSLYGKWRIEGNTLITELDWKPLLSGMGQENDKDTARLALDATGKEIRKGTIVELGLERLSFEGSMPYKRVK